MSRMSFIATAAALGSLLACDNDPVGQPERQGVTPPDALLGVLNAQDEHGSRHISILDDCDASDPGWNATGGCALRKGAVDEAEFSAFLLSPLSSAVVGHLAWRNQPSYLRIRPGESVRVTNLGGRNHTFTPVAQFGGGRVPPLRVGLTLAPECALAMGATDPFLVAPGGRLEFDDLAAGDHRYQCCLHPWMRAHIKVQ